MNPLAIDYLLMVFLASSGIIQLVASHSGLRGLLILQRPILSTALGFTLTVSALIWFFTKAERNLPDTAGGIDGPTQSWEFALGCFLALLSAQSIGSIVNIGLAKHHQVSVPAGINALRETTYLHALTTKVPKTWKL